MRIEAPTCSPSFPSTAPPSSAASTSPRAAPATRSSSPSSRSRSFFCFRFRVWDPGAERSSRQYHDADKDLIPEERNRGRIIRIVVASCITGGCVLALMAYLIYARLQSSLISFVFVEAPGASTMYIPPYQVTDNNTQHGYQYA
ncbi:hypothetical protein B0H10DRAFT_2223440 [Mycena sp. CBHHK59/15]|nr:hypothetical protein B0H10DRAFT_2223440 [Mycena sp. CBHHK59/15]